MFRVLSEIEKSSLTQLSEKGYVFEWTSKTTSRSVTVAKIAGGDIAGLVEFERQPENMCNHMWLIEVGDIYKGTGIAGKLLAYVGRDSIEVGFEGFVVFETKTALYRYYQDKYGAKPLDGRRLFFDTTASNYLIQKYLGGTDD